MKKIVAIAVVFCAVLLGAYSLSEYAARQIYPELNAVPHQLGAPFKLVTHTGAPITEQAFTGQPSAVFFGFTHCPEVCPTTLNDLTVLRDRLEGAENSFNIFFITVDPARDTPESLADFIPYFGSGITGITGQEEAVYALAKSWGIYWEKNNITEYGYNIDHTATVFLLDAQGRFKGTIDFHESREIAFQKLQRLIKSSQS
jgi:protein SCO1/2